MSDQDLMDAVDCEQVLSLVLGGTTFAVEAEMVLEVLDDSPMLTVPNCQPYVKGLINMRGKVIPVVDLQILLGALPRKSRNDARDRRIVVLTLPMPGETVLVGVIADAVHQVIPLNTQNTETIPSVGMEWDSALIKYIGKNNGAFIMCLDTEKIFNPLFS